MITSLSWLKNHLATKANLNEIAERLTEIGLEVENIRSSNMLKPIIPLVIVKTLKGSGVKPAKNIIPNQRKK